MTFYDELQAVATELLTEFKQGIITYTTPPITSGPSYDPVSVPGDMYTLNATAKGVSKGLVDGSFIVASDLEVTAAVFAVEPETAGKIAIDGREHQIVQVRAVPAGGTTVAWRLIVRA